MPPRADAATVKPRDNTNAGPGNDLLGLKPKAHTSNPFRHSIRSIVFLARKQVTSFEGKGQEFNHRLSKAKEGQDIFPAINQTEG